MWVVTLQIGLIRRKDASHLLDMFSEVELSDNEIPPNNEERDEENERCWSSHRQATPPSHCSNVWKWPHNFLVKKYQPVLQKCSSKDPLEGLTRTYYRLKPPTRPRWADGSGATERRFPRVSCAFVARRRGQTYNGVALAFACQRRPHLAALSSALLPFSSPLLLRLYPTVVSSTSRPNHSCARQGTNRTGE